MLDGSKNTLDKISLVNLYSKLQCCVLTPLVGNNKGLITNKYTHTHFEKSQLIFNNVRINSREFSVFYDHLEPEFQVKIEFDMSTKLLSEDIILSMVIVFVYY